MTTVFNDGVLEADLFEDQWIFVRWVTNTHGRLQKRLIRDLNYIEKAILLCGFKGWFTMSERAHTDFHKLLMKFGAVPGKIDGEFQYFAKPIVKEGDLHYVRNSR